MHPCLSFPHAHYNSPLTMGYLSLETHLPPSHAPLLPPGDYLSITDTQASDGNFLLHHFISNYVKADQNVVLVGLAGILAHYTMVGRKLASILSREENTYPSIYNVHANVFHIFLGCKFGDSKDEGQFLLCGWIDSTDGLRSTKQGTYCSTY